MLRRVRVFALFAAVAAALCYAAGGVPPAATVEAAHDYTALAIRRAEAYRHVLEEDDLLVLVQYAASEDLSDEEEDPFGVNGAILRVKDDGGVIKQAPLPLTGYAIKAFYWEADLVGDEITWGDANVQAEIEGNPVLFETPQDDAENVNWNADADHDAMVETCTEDLREIFIDLEQDDPDVDAQEYIQAGGITMEGMGLVEVTFPHLIYLCPDAFILSVEPIGTPFDPPDPVEDPPIGVEDETVKDDITAGFAEFGVPFNAAALIVMMVAIGLTGFAIYKTKGRAEVLLVYIGPFMIWASLAVGVSIIVVATIHAVIFIAGAAAAFVRFMPT
jgi:hypothetical protein